MSALILGGISLGSALINMAGGFLQQSGEQDRISRIQRALEEAKITDTEKDSMLDRTDDLYNSRTLESLNTNSIGLALSGISNPEVAQGVLAGKMLGERQEALLDQENYIKDFNSNIEIEQAKVETQSTVNNPFADFMTGGIGGLQAGLSVMDSIKAEEHRMMMMELLRLQMGSGYNDPSTTARN